jgi:phytoene dehydrogenase-like protein
MAGIAPQGDPRFRAFLDGQLLISAQTTAEQANALYGSAALDLPRRGVNHVQGGIGSLAKTLAAWITAHGGELLYRQPVQRITQSDNGRFTVETKKRLQFTADTVVANTTPWALHELLGDAAPRSLRREVSTRPPTWGAFTLYLGLDRSALPERALGHHQVIVDPAKPLGEGNSVFISLADPADTTRAPAGKIPATLSTHTSVTPWWGLFKNDRSAYLARREVYAERLLQAAERALPGIGKAVRLCLPGTPVTFDFYTRRPQGMVGGFPQTSLFTARGPRTGIRNLWLVGDSIFPGQSTAGVTLGALRVAAAILPSTPA